MNKKILSLAVAAAIAAPMAAQADVTVNGAVARDLYNQSNQPNSLYGNDFGTSKLEFNVNKGGDAFAKIAFDIRAAAFGDATLNTLEMPAREQYAGVKVGGVNVSVGRLGSAYAGTMKVDAMTANFMEARKNAGGVSKVASFESGMLGISGKAGDVSYNFQYGIADPTNPRTQLGVKFKAGAATVGVALHQDNAGNSSTGLSAKMKFGDVALGVSAESADGAYMAGGLAGTSQTEIFVDAAMPMGGGTIGAGLGSNTDASTTFARVSYSQKMGAATVNVGASSADSVTRAGVQLKVAF